MFGFTRQNYDNDTPDLIIYTCLLFYAPISVFEKYPKEIEYSGNTFKSKGGDRWRSLFGRTWIDSTSADLVEWKIKPHNDGNFLPRAICFGIVSSQHDQNTDNDFAETAHSMGWTPKYPDDYFQVDTLFPGPIDKLHREISVDDEITLILDMKSTTLSYYLSNEKSHINVPTMLSSTIAMTL